MPNVKCSKSRKTYEPWDPLPTDKSCDGDNWIRGDRLPIPGEIDFDFSSLFGVFDTAREGCEPGKDGCAQGHPPVIHVFDTSQFLDVVRAMRAKAGTPSNRNHQLLTVDNLRIVENVNWGIPAGAYSPRVTFTFLSTSDRFIAASKRRAADFAGSFFAKSIDSGFARWGRSRMLGGTYGGYGRPFPFAQTLDMAFHNIPITWSWLHYQNSGNAVLDHAAEWQNALLHDQCKA